MPILRCHNFEKRIFFYLIDGASCHTLPLLAKKGKKKFPRKFLSVV
jgi:hypothetical protein